MNDAEMEEIGTDPEEKTTGICARWDKQPRAEIGTCRISTPSQGVDKRIICICAIKMKRRKTDSTVRVERRDQDMEKLRV